MPVWEVKKQLRELAAEVGRGGLGAVGGPGGAPVPWMRWLAVSELPLAPLGGKDPLMVELSP